MMNFLLLIIQTNLEQYTEKIPISVELHKWNTKIKLEYIYKLEFDEKFRKINVIQIPTVSSCFTFLIPQGIALKPFTTINALLSEIWPIFWYIVELVELYLLDLNSERNKKRVCQKVIINTTDKRNWNVFYLSSGNNRHATEAITV
jgi:hypothetical protein